MDNGKREKRDTGNGKREKRDTGNGNGKREKRDTGGGSAGKPYLKTDFSPPDITGDEISAVCDALRSGWITTGPRTKLLERRLAAYIETGRTDVDCSAPGAHERYARKVACLNSATAAEEMNLRILGIGPGDEVIVPAYTYTASASAVIHCGATVVFVDSRRDGDPVTHSPEPDPDAVEAAITERTKAVVTVDFAGIMCDYDRVFRAAENKRHLFRAANGIQERLGRVAVVADAAHSLGASRHGKNAGEAADLTSFSFHAVKNLTTAEGGAAAWNIPGADDGEIYERCMLYSLHGQTRDALAKSAPGSWEYDIAAPLYKCNMTDIAAALGLAQLDRYPRMLERRKNVIAEYDETCDALGLFRLNHFGPRHAGSAHLYTVRIPGIAEKERNMIIGKLAEAGIAANVHYKPLPMMTAYRNLGWDIGDFPNARAYYENLISLPLHSRLTDAEVRHVCDRFGECVRAVRGR